MRGAKHVVTRQTKGRAPPFGLTRTFDCVRGAAHVVTMDSDVRCWMIGVGCWVIGVGSLVIAITKVSSHREDGD